MKNIYLRLVIVLLSFNLFAVFNLCGQEMDYDDFDIQIDKFFRVLKTSETFYVEEIDTEELVTTAIKAALEKLDPHSIYLSPKKMESENEKFKGSFEGIGIQFMLIDDTINVISAIPGGPSERLGIMSGDKIVNIESESAIGLDNEVIRNKLRGPKGTQVNVDILRYGEPELIPFEIIRDKIPLYSVTAAFIINESDIGYLSINNFTSTTHREFLDSMKKLSDLGMKKLILDLRGNPGGYLNQAFLIADEFIEKGHKIVYTKGRIPEFNEDYYSRAGGKYEKLPLIVLVDAGSASASEIVSGSIQDLDRGLVVGVTTYGKGLVQRQYPLPDKSGFRITIAKYYTSSGRCIQRPYKDKDKYRSMDGWFDLKEGKNINHALEDAITENLDSLPPIYKTLSGRNVLGGGGITPDYVVKYDTITKLSRTLRAKNILYFYSRAFIDENEELINKNYKNDFKKYLHEFEIADDMIEDLRKLSESKEIEWNEEEYKKDEKYLKTFIKSSIARSLWANNEAIQAFLPINKHINTAIELFPEAINLANLDEK
jgi:carboxyl-terminal processing protease